MDFVSFLCPQSRLVEEPADQQEKPPQSANHKNLFPLKLLKLKEEPIEELIEEPPRVNPESPVPPEQELGEAKEEAKGDAQEEPRQQPREEARDDAKEVEKKEVPEMLCYRKAPHSKPRS